MQTNLAVLLISFSPEEVVVLSDFRALLCNKSSWQAVSVQNNQHP